MAAARLSVWLVGYQSSHKGVQTVASVASGVYPACHKECGTCRWQGPGRSVLREGGRVWQRLPSFIHASPCRCPCKFCLLCACMCGWLLLLTVCGLLVIKLLFDAAQPSRTNGAAGASSWRGCCTL